MRPRTCFAREGDRIERSADIPESQVVMPMNSVVVPFVARVTERANLSLIIDRRAEIGAVVLLTGAAVEVAHCHFCQLFPGGRDGPIFGPLLSKLPGRR
jgi:hypothetical protein